MASSKKLIFLFDMDGTVTPPRQRVEPWMMEFLQNLRKKAAVGMVGGSDLKKLVEQMGATVEDLCSKLDYLFAENGLVGYKNGVPYPVMSIQKHMGEDLLQTFINFCLEYISKIQLPAKRGTFVEFRNGMLNISPIGRSCSLEERKEFVEFDIKNKVREIFLEAMRARFPTEKYGLHFSIGGQLSIDVFPVGWDKSYCLKYLVDDGFDEIHFFGDRTMPNGNDHEIFEDPRTIGHTVTSPEDTKAQVEKVLQARMV